MNTRKSLATVLALSLLALTLAVGARPAWQKYKSWRATSLLEDSARFEKDGSLVVAFQKAHAAYLLDRDNPTATRAVARIGTAMRHPQAADFWEIVVSNEAATPEDFALAVEAAIGLRRTDRASAWMDVWRRRHAGDHGPSRRRAEILMLAAQGDLNSCLGRITEFRKAQGGLPPSLSMLEARLSLALDPASGVDRAGQLFLEAGRSPTVEGAQALLLAATFANLPAPVRLEAAGRLLEHASATLPQQLLARLTQASLGQPVDAELAAVVDQVLQLSESPERASALASLLAAGRSALLLERLPAQRARQAGDLTRVHLEACLLAGKAQLVLESTEDSSHGTLSPAVGLVFRARAFTQLGDATSARENLAQAIDLATEDDFALLERNLRDTGDKRLLLEYFERLADRPGAAVLARASAASTAYELGDLERIDRHLAHIDPAALKAVPDLQRRIVYLMTLRNVRPAEALRIAEDAFAGSGAVLPSRLLLAFANARIGRLDTARALVDGVAPESCRRPEEAVMLSFSRSPAEFQWPGTMLESLQPFERALVSGSTRQSG